LVLLFILYAHPELLTRKNACRGTAPDRLADPHAGFSITGTTCYFLDCHL